MLEGKRSSENPIILPDSDSPWESEAAYNPSPVVFGGMVYLLYRATGKAESGQPQTSSIGIASGRDGVHFKDRRQFIVPEHPWEQLGCEDPRPTAFEGRFYVFYTAVESFTPDGIKVGVAISDDLATISEKHLVTPFNAKAMALFPERVNGKIAAVLTVNTDRPPAKIALALFDRIEDVWSETYWKDWYAHLNDHVIPIDVNEKDQIEVGSAPVRTDKGWLLFYSYIYNYFSPPAIFGVQALLLNIDDPQRVEGEVKRPFLVPEEEYEQYGRVPRIIFPSGALLRHLNVYLYYGAADTTSCLSMFKLKDLLEELVFIAGRQLARFEGNPIVTPITEHSWESKATFNPGAVYEGGKVHLLYRAMSDDNTSVLGYAASLDGVHFTERSPGPAYVPRAEFERKLVPGGNSGCEDPRLTKLGDRIYLCYTAFDGKGPPRVAFSSILAADLIAKKWNWASPVLISPVGLDDKDAALFPRKIGGKYFFLHRIGGSDIWIDGVDSLEFDGETKFLGGKILMRPRDTAWDSKRIGISAPPIETPHGWLLLYHGISKRTSHYSVRAALLDINDPSNVLYRTEDTILDPQMPYEKQGITPNTVFPCGTVLIRGELFVYYGGADSVVAVATVALADLLSGLLHQARFHRK